MPDFSAAEPAGLRPARRAAGSQCLTGRSCARCQRFDLRAIATHHFSATRPVPVLNQTYVCGTHAKLSNSEPFIEYKKAYIYPPPRAVATDIHLIHTFALNHPSPAACQEVLVEWTCVDMAGMAWGVRTRVEILRKCRPRITAG